MPQNSSHDYYLELAKKPQNLLRTKAGYFALPPLTFARHLKKRRPAMTLKVAPAPEPNWYQNLLIHKGSWWCLPRPSAHLQKSRCNSNCWLMYY